MAGETGFCERVSGAVATVERTVRQVERTVRQVEHTVRQVEHIVPQVEHTVRHVEHTVRHVEHVIDQLVERVLPPISRLWNINDHHSSLASAEMIDRVGDMAATSRIAPLDDPVGAQPNAPSVPLLDPMVPTAQTDEIGGAGRARRPRNHMVDVALTGRNHTAREAAPSITLADEVFEALSGAVGLARELIPHVY